MLLLLVDVVHPSRYSCAFGALISRHLLASLAVFHAEAQRRGDAEQQIEGNKLDADIDLHYFLAT